MKLILQSGRYAICRLAPSAGFPRMGGEFWSVTRTGDETSFVCEEQFIPEGVAHESGWRLIRFDGTFAFSEVGVLASVAIPLRDAGVPVLAISTFDTDYVLVKQADLAAASRALAAAGHDIESS